MVLDPNIQVQAQRTIDEVCPGRLPTFKDRPDLPYIDAIMKETLRWNLVLPLSTLSRFAPTSTNMNWVRCSASVGGRRHVQRILYSEGLDSNYELLVSQSSVSTDYY